jgi:ABC-2 type transport system permease protein
MKNILLVLKREYLVRVKKKSFIVMTLLTPLLFVLFYAGIIWTAVRSVETKLVTVLDKSGLLKDGFENSEELEFRFTDSDLELAKSDFGTSTSDALLYIPVDVMENRKGVQIYARKNVSLELKSKLEKAIEEQIEDIKLRASGITPQIIADAKTNITAQTLSLEEGEEKESNSGAATAIALVCGMIIYFAVLLYGTQVMRSVSEEKTSRIVEVIISSVKPFQLLVGKIVGVALVGLTQFALWIVLTLILVSGAGYVLKDRLTDIQKEASAQQISSLPGNVDQTEKSGTQSNPAVEMLDGIKSLNLPLILGSFLFYFLGGYLLYSALLGAVGSAVDHESDTQQFVFPITLPLIFGFIVAQMAIRDPDSPLIFWASMVPLTSPIVMMVRIPFGVPGWQIALSMFLLILGFLGTVWIASRIYRVGILMYGKKVTYKELMKWLFYKN